MNQQVAEGKKHETLDSFLTADQVGDFVFVPDHLYVRTPAGVAMLPIDEACGGEWGGPCWKWDGNQEQPTLSPSIYMRGENEWHGWMREGRLVAA